MTAAGYDVTLGEFPFVFTPPAVPRQFTPSAATYETGTFTGTGYGDVTAAVTAVDINLLPPRDSTSGCEAADVAGFPAGNIALIQRGTCSFAVKALNAQAAGATAVIIFNQGNTPQREDLIIGTLAPSTANIPVVGASFANGVALSRPGATARVKADAPQNVTQVNVLAESKDGDPNNVVMVGAHLDSVQRGPGIQDSAAILEVAEAVLWGGTAGQQYDPCYHLACDTYDNVNLFALGANADAIAYAVLQFAMNTHAINGKRGKGNFKFDYWGPQPKE